MLHARREPDGTTTENRTVTEPTEQAPALLWAEVVPNPGRYDRLLIERLSGLYGPSAVCAAIQTLAKHDTLTVPAVRKVLASPNHPILTAIVEERDA
jgi:hypothetical protein